MNNKNSVETLLENFKSRKELNRSYSIYAYARDLEISYSQLNKILNGSRKISPNIACKIGFKLKLKPEQVIELIRSSINEEKNKNISQ